MHVEIARDGDQADAEERMGRERAMGLDAPSFYRDLATRMLDTKHDLAQTLARFDRVAGYGAAAKAVSAGPVNP